MSVQVRRRREAAAFLQNFVGAQGELLVDTTNNRVQVHDGVTPGGFPAARLSEVVTNARKAVSDGNYTVQPGDRSVAFVALSAARSLALPAAATYPTGTPLMVFDESGACSSTNTITIGRNGSDTINGATSVALGSAYGFLVLESNGAGQWTVIGQGPSAGGGSSTPATNTPAANKNNSGATGYPSSTNDASQGYAPGSLWLLPATAELFVCRDATTGAAVWTRNDNADFFGYVANRWYLPMGISAAASGTAPGSGVMRLFPWVNKQRVTLAALGVRIFTVSSGGNAQVALYATNPSTKRPTGTPLASTASLSTTTAAAVSAAVGVQIEPGLYWFATNCDNTTAAFTSIASTNFTQAQIAGAANETGASGYVTAPLGFTFSQAFGSWPDLTSASLSETTTNVQQTAVVHFQVASVP